MTVHPPILEYVIYVRRTPIGESLDGCGLGTGTESRCGLGIHRLVRGDEQAGIGGDVKSSVQSRILVGAMMKYMLEFLGPMVVSQVNSLLLRRYSRTPTAGRRRPECGQSALPTGLLAEEALVPRVQQLLQQQLVRWQLRIGWSMMIGLRV